MLVALLTFGSLGGCEWLMENPDHRTHHEVSERRSVRRSNQLERDDAALNPEARSDGAMNVMSEEEKIIRARSSYKQVTIPITNDAPANPMTNSSGVVIRQPSRAKKRGWDTQIEMAQSAEDRRALQLEMNTVKAGVVKPTAPVRTIPGRP